MTTRLTAAGSYTIPEIDVQVASTFTSSPGVPLQANWNVPSLEAAKSLGRPLSGSVPNVVVNLLAPDQLAAPRVNIWDVRFGKVMRIGPNRALVGVDMYNFLNLDTVITQNFNYVPNGQWLVPTSVLTARTVKLTVQYSTSGGLSALGSRLWASVQSRSFSSISFIFHFTHLPDLKVRPTCR